MSGATPSFSGTISRLIELFDVAKTWSSPDIFLPVATSLADDTLVAVNLSDTIGQTRRPERVLINDTTSYFLPKAKYSCNDATFRQDVLAPLLVLACQQAGFFVVMKGWEKATNKVVFHCQRS